MKSKYILSIFIFTMFFGSKVGAQGEANQSLPMMIIIDQGKEEIPSQDQLRVLSANLMNSIYSKKFPILATKSILYNLLERKEHWDKPGRKEDSEIRFLTFEPFDGATGWRIYNVSNGLFFLLVHSDFLAQYGNDTGLQIDKEGNSLSTQLENITDLFKKESYLRELEKMADLQGAFNIEDLKNVFKKRVSRDKEDLVKVLASKSWNIVLDGHGVKGEKVADLDSRQLKDFLSFLNNYINTALLFVMSCYAGGINRIKFKEIAGEQIGSSLNYLVIVQGVSDQPTYGDFFTPIFYIAQSANKGMPLNVVLKEINILSVERGFLHPTHHIPQVLLPGGLEFQTFNINEKVLSLGYVFVEKHRLESKPIEAKSKEAVLVYPHIVLPTLLVNQKKSNMLWLLRLRQPLLVGFELLDTVKDFESQIKEHAQHFPVYEKLDTYALDEEAEKYLVYPEFISMQPKEDDKKHWFKRIEVLNDDISEAKDVGVVRGVMQFLRDAFINSELKVGQQFFIEQLVGPNDVSLLMELSRIQAKQYEPYELEKKLSVVAGKEIVLEKVWVVARAAGAGAPSIVSFILSDPDKPQAKIAWRVTAKVEMRDKKKYSLWSFQKIGLKPHERVYNGFVDGLRELSGFEEVTQKTIPEILKQKRLQIPEEKQEEACVQLQKKLSFRHTRQRKDKNYKNQKKDKMRLVNVEQFNIKNKCGIWRNNVANATCTIS